MDLQNLVDQLSLMPCAGAWTDAERDGFLRRFDALADMARKEVSDLVKTAGVHTDIVTSAPLADKHGILPFDWHAWHVEPGPVNAAADALMREDGPVPDHHIGTWLRALDEGKSKGDAMRKALARLPKRLAGGIDQANVQPLLAALFVGAAPDRKLARAVPSGGAIATALLLALFDNGNDIGACRVAQWLQLYPSSVGHALTWLLYARMRLRDQATFLASQNFKILTGTAVGALACDLEHGAIDAANQLCRRPMVVDALTRILRGEDPIASELQQPSAERGEGWKIIEHAIASLPRLASHFGREHDAIACLVPLLQGNFHDQAAIALGWLNADASITHLTELLHREPASVPACVAVCAMGAKLASVEPSLTKQVGTFADASNFVRDGWLHLALAAIAPAKWQAPAVRGIAAMATAAAQQVIIEYEEGLWTPAECLGELGAFAIIGRALTLNPTAEQRQSLESARLLMQSAFAGDA